MPKCQSCGHRWSLKNTGKIAFKFRGNNGRACAHCGNTQYVSKKSVNRMGIAGITIVVLMLLIRPLLPPDFLSAMALAVPFAVVLIVVDLFLMELSSVQPAQRRQ